MTCKDCVHQEACFDWCRGFELKVEKCEHFKDKSLFIELPCKVGDTVYECWYTPCHFGETFPDSYGCCGCEYPCDISKGVIAHHNVSFVFIIQKLDRFGVEEDGNCMGRYFLTEEEAEKALKEREEK